MERNYANEITVKLFLDSVKPEKQTNSEEIL
jgi:hypothetical protein